MGTRATGQSVEGYAMSATPHTTPPADEMREFMLVLHRALTMITAWIEKRYGLQRRG